MHLPQIMEMDIMFSNRLNWACDIRRSSVIHLGGNKFGIQHLRRGHPKESWDGKGKGEIVPQGSYVWIAKTDLSMGQIEL